MAGGASPRTDGPMASSNRSIEQQIPALKDEDAQVRRLAAKELGERGATRAILPLAQALQDEQWTVCLDAALA